MRILVTGVTGYIGSNLVPQLLDDGHDVSVLVRDPQQLEFFEWVSKINLYSSKSLFIPVNPTELS